ncbi:hypothetical protein CROQUDRAFT_653065 [Cronartium quercuum f. sp. fusiforme G11]|uniref:RNA-binding protein n=1 Tax=Cronartium quercuum f. sp. fusiforme G11 TaxID=708437 RepID=A0A9P6NT38_9BASI|nr:hypothetical protein CROQUDRAFT_653065 [Cronartium quercuum f. sp. fusiforme G11]
MYSRHPTDHIRQPQTRPTWDRSNSQLQHHERSYPDPRFQSTERPNRTSYSGPPRDLERVPHGHQIDDENFDDNRRPYEEVHRHQNIRRSQDFGPSPQRNSRHISYDQDYAGIPTEPYHHSSSRGGPPFPRSYPSKALVHHHHHHERPHGTWNPDYHKHYDPNTQFNHGPPKEKSTPTHSVIFMGLPIHTDEANLRAFLEEGGAIPDTVTIIYDRNTGISKRYGFARFATIDDARAFVEPSFPLIVWKEPIGSRFDNSGDGLKIKIDYSQREKIPFEARNRERDSIARRSPPIIDLNDDPSGRSHSYNSPQEPTSSNINDGARDIGGTPTSILLLRGLDPISSEQEIAKHLQHIPDPSQTVHADSIRKVMLIKDRLSNVSWGYAFVQFADVQIAVKALSLLLNTSLFPRGFQIRSRTLTVTFAHEHSFHPVYTPSDWSFRGPGGQELAYWDDKAYAAVYVPIIHINEDSNSSNNNVKTNQDWYDRKNQSVRDEDADMKELLTSLDDDHNGTKPDTTNKISGGSPSQNHHFTSDSPTQENRNIDESKNRKLSSADRPENESRDPRLSHNRNLNSKSDLSHPIDNPEYSSNPKDAKSEKKKGTELIASKKMAANIEKWNSKKNQENQISSSSSSIENSIEINNENLINNENDDEDFSDLERLTCLLCQRQFKVQIELQRHNELSNLHKTNLQNEELKQTARQRKQVNLKSIKRSASNSELNEGTKYTDRAAARREIYGQPDIPQQHDTNNKKARYEPPPLPIQSPIQPDKDGIQSSNVGSKMLAKMGWNQGEGLGNGNGRVDPIAAAQYTKGVGLGASTGTVVGLYEDNKKGFIEQIKDKTVERFNQD